LERHINTAFQNSARAKCEPSDEITGYVSREVMNFAKERDWTD
jgi:hypothetical protein